MLADEIIIDKRTQVFVQKFFDFGYLVRSAETVEEVQERHA